ncbi:BON domain-containing protein [Flavihumibacter sp. R14]|nr:BON domain-containing protein [Flavihumibacter soli]
MKLLFLRKNLMVAMLAVSTLLFACKASDSKIQEAAQAKTTAIDPGVTVAVNEGVATLTGQVDDQTTQDALANAVKDVKGVKSVVNNTTVASPDVQVNPDDQIRAAIEENFLEAGVRGVDFTVASGVVTLTGEVSRNDLTKVMQAANEAKPKKINNQLKITN